MSCPKAIHHSSSSLTSNIDMQQGPNNPMHATHLQQGLTNPEYKSTQQDWPDVKGGWRTLEMQVLGQGKDVAKFKSSLPKAYYSSFYFQVLPLSLLSSLSQTKYSYLMFHSFSFHSFFSYFSNSPVLHCFCNESSLHICGAPAIRIDSSPSWGFLITQHM